MPASPGIGETVYVNGSVVSSELPLAFVHSFAYDLPAMTVGTPIAQRNVSGTVSGGVPPYTFSATGLPAGIAISATGIISGTPLAASPAGSATITVRDANSAADSITIAYGAISPATVLPPPKSDWTRLSGTDRHDTMAAIVSEGWKTSEYVVVASSANFPDALAASSLAGVHDAPVVLTAPTALSAQARDAIASLGAAHVYLIGGTAAVSASVERSLAAIPGVADVTRLSGTDRTATARAIHGAAKGSWGATAVIASGTGFADALSISPYAHATNAPIFLASPKAGLDTASLSAIKAGGFTRIVIVGGPAAVAAATEGQLTRSAPGATVTRLAGDDRYQTSADIAKFSVSDTQGKLALNNIVCATGTNYPDALAGGAFAGHIGTVLLLVDNSTAGRQGLESLVRTNATNIGTGHVLGGTSAVPEKVLQDLTGASRSS
jgi:putative cell wall-binding protein